MMMISEPMNGVRIDALHKKEKQVEEKLRLQHFRFDYSIYTNVKL